jgi:flagellar basal-body rod protein FlgC
MSFLTALRGTASALTAERLRMDVISSNIANADTTRTAEGGPYRRHTVVFQPGESAQPFQAVLARFRDSSDAPSLVAGVNVSSIVEDSSPGRQVYDPTHPDANAQGFVEYPNVDTLTEMTDLISASRAYEANVTVANALKSMAIKALEIGRA